MLISSCGAYMKTIFVQYISAVSLLGEDSLGRQLLGVDRTLTSCSHLASDVDSR